jgi:UDP-N-acetylglucosamine 4,6-dehydratase
MSIFKNNVFIITGGTGSFGKKMLEYLIKKNVPEIRVLSRDEKKQEDLRLKLNNKKVKFFIGDVRDKSSFQGVFDGADYVFHAAALKQVPSCEFYPMEAIKTNIHGTENVINASIKYNLKSMVLLSTDKSVYPVNVMGMSKAVAEKLLISKIRNTNNINTRLCITRYGNVMGSRGSVIPLFINQIKNNKPITITDPQMTRFLMSLDDSISLVEKAFTSGQQGDIFIKKSPSVSIEILVKALTEIFESKTKLKIIGTRHGEKLYETLVSREEMLRVKSSKDYFCIKADMRTINYDEFFFKGKKDIHNINEYNSHNCEKLSVDQTIKILSKMQFIKNELK